MAVSMSIHDMNSRAYPTCDNACTMLGWVEALVSDGSCGLHISHHPDADLDDRFPAFCHDEQAMIRVSGWQMLSYDII